jgi:hypothetical protein
MLYDQILAVRPKSEVVLFASYEKNHFSCKQAFRVARSNPARIYGGSCLQIKEKKKKKLLYWGWTNLLKYYYTFFLALTVRDVFCKMVQTERSHVFRFFPMFLLIFVNLFFFRSKRKQKCFILCWQQMDRKIKAGRASTLYEFHFYESETF